MIRVAGDRDVEIVLEADQTLHGVSGRRIHSNAPIPVERHESERLIDGVVDYREIDPVAFRDSRPVVNAGAAERIDADAKPARAIGIDVDDIAEIAHVAVEIVVPVRGGGAQRLLVRRCDARPRDRCSSSSFALASIQLVTVVSAPPPFGRIVLESSVCRRIVRWRHDDAVGESGRAPAIVAHDRMRHCRRGRVLIVLREHDVDAMRSEHLERGRARGRGQCVRVDPEKERTIDRVLRGDSGRSPR